MQNSQTATINNNVTFGDIARIKNGYAFKKTDFLQNGVPLIRQSNLGGTKVDLSGCVYLPESYLEKHKNFLLKKGDVLLGMSGSLGKICYYNLDQPALQNQRTGKVEITHPEKVTDRYFWYFLNTIESRLIGLSKGTGVNNVSASDIESLDIYLPSIDDQNNVTKKLDSYLPKVGMSSEKIVNAKQLLLKFRQSILSAAVTGKLTEGWRAKNPSLESAESLLQIIKQWRIDNCNSKNDKEKVEATYAQIKSNSSEIDNELEIPDTWVHCKIDHIGQVVNGSTPSRKVAHYWNGEIPWVSSGEVKNSVITETREKITKEGFDNASVKMLPPGTVLIAMIGEGKTRGQTSILKIAATTNQNIAAIMVGHKQVIPEYLWYWFRMQYLATRHHGSGSGPQALSCARVKELPFVLPPLLEQIEIVRQLDHLFEITKVVEQQIAKIEDKTDKLTQSILAKAFRGEL